MATFFCKIIGEVVVVRLREKQRNFLGLFNFLCVCTLSSLRLLFPHLMQIKKLP
jgi:hypothetical protein